MSFSRSLLFHALAAALALSASPSAFAQSTTGTLYGQAEAGSTIRIQSATGTTREIQVGADGQYRSPALPVGEYTLSAVRDGQPLGADAHVLVKVGVASEVSFAAPASTAGATNLGAVKVSASAVP